MKREELSQAISSIDPKFVLEAETYSWKKRRLTWLWRGGAAVAALLCLVAVLYALLPQQPAGLFTVKAYALDLDEDGMVVLREEDLLEKSDYWGGYCDGENYYVSMGLRYEGENIERVTFTTQEGFFAQQRITPDIPEEQVSSIYVGPENKLIVFGEEFTVSGSSVTLEGTEMEEGLLLFWGIQALSADDIPKNPNITAEAVFRDGGTQTVNVCLDLSGMGVFGGSAQTDDRDGMPVAYHQSQYYQNLPLADCELVDEQTVTDLYEYTIDGYTLTIQVPERELFDEDGQYRGRRQRISGAFYLPVFRLEGDTCVTQLYKVPQELEYSRENEAKQQAERENASVPDVDLPEESPLESKQTENPERQVVKPPSAEITPEQPAPEVPAQAPGSQETSGNGGFTVHSGTVSEEVRLKSLARLDYYCALPVSELELIHEEPVTDMFTYRIGDIQNGLPISENLEFNEDGYYLDGVHNHDEGTFVTILYRDGNGSLWGQIYRVPEELVYPE